MKVFKVFGSSLCHISLRVVYQCVHLSLNLNQGPVVCVELVESWWDEVWPCGISKMNIESMLSVERDLEDTDWIIA